MVDTLVHNYLHRTGVLRSALAADHAYGPRCYAANGCASIIQAAATEIDAQRLRAAITRDIFQGLSSTASGGFAPWMVWMSATAIAWMIESDAKTDIAGISRACQTCNAKCQKIIDK